MTGRCSRRAVLGGLAIAGAAGPVAATERPPTRRSTRQGGDEPPGNLDNLASFLDGVINAQLEAHSIAGATVAVVDGDTEFAKGYGYSDVEASEPVRADETLFRIGSVSKLFAWTAAMQAVERGDLDVDTDVNRYLDGFEIPNTYDVPITLEHLATHTPGFEDRLRGTFVLEESDLRPLETMLREERPARVRPPGEFTAYSNYGAALAGHIATKDEATSFERYVETEIFEPLGMDRSTFEQPVPEPLAEDLSKGYTADGGAFRPGEFEYVGMPPTGAMSATATDMAAFMRAHLDGGATDDGRILESDSVEAMHRRRFGHDDRVNGMAFGFYELRRNGVRAVGHGGDTSLFHSLLFLLPDEDVGVFVSYNSPGGLEARREFLDAFFSRYYPTADSTPPVPDEAPTRAEDVTGTYRALRVPYTTSEKVFGAASTVSVMVDDRGRLVTTSLGGETQRWVEQEPLFFEEVGGDDAIAFRESDGEITHLFFDSRPPSAYERVAVHEEPLNHAVVAGISVLVFVSALVGWPLAAARRRYRGAERPTPESPMRYARWVGGATAALFVGFLSAFAASVLTDPLELVLGDPLQFRVLLVLPALGVLASVVTAGFAVLAWRERHWGNWTRIHYTLVALAGLAFALVLAYWNLLWYQM